MFCEKLDVTSPLLFGTSAGGWVALKCAVTNPDFYSGLVLDTTMPGDAEETIEVFERLGGPEVAAIARQSLSGSNDVGV